ncbi:hypothetical protein G6F56_012287 [Rhizopus delemar]|nr:hypothetical protein G6F56_012287 [Rhizopus delemar]
MVGKLSVTPVTARNIPDIQGAKFFVGCFIQETEKHRTHSVEGREPTWKNTLTCQIPEGQRHVLTVELVNESPNGGLLGYGKVDLAQVLHQGNESKWVPLTSTNGQPLGELKLDLSLNGSSAVNSVTSSMGSMHLTEQANYFPDSRQGSFSSLGPANPIPQNYGSALVVQPRPILKI